MITLYGINNCDTIRKTRKWLQRHGVDYQFHDYRKAGCPRELAALFLNHFSHEQLINKRGTTWRKLPDSVKQSLDRESAVTLMSEQPSLIKRPLLNHAGKWIVGFDTKQMEHLLP